MPSDLQPSPAASGLAKVPAVAGEAGDEPAGTGSGGGTYTLVYPEFLVYSPVYHLRINNHIISYHIISVPHMAHMGTNGSAAAKA